MIRDSVAFCRRGRQAGGLRRRALLRRLPRRPGLRPGMRAGGRRRGSRERHPLRTPTAAACRASSARRRQLRSRRSGGGDAEVGIHTPQRRRSARSPTHWPRSAPGRAWSRAASTATASAAATPTWPSILPALQLKMGFDVVSAEQLAEPDADSPLPGRGLQHGLRPRSRLRRPQRLRPQGGDARRRVVAADASTFEHPRPRRGRQRARDPRLRALRQGDDPQPGGARGAGARRRCRGAGGRAAEAAGAPRLPLRGGAGLLRAACCGARPAATSRCSSSRAFRVVTEKRADGGVETEATIKVEVDGERLPARGRGQRPGQRARPRPAGGDRRPLPAPGRHRADQLQGPHPRRSARHRRRHPGPARLRRRRPRVGDDRRLRDIIEASWEALVDSLEYAFQ
jgi:hypothetical protein